MTQTAKTEAICDCSIPDLVTEDVTDADRTLFLEIVSTRLTEDQERAIAAPEAVFPRERSVLATHWHPEHIPMPLIARRVQHLFPSAEETLFIPTQHNQITTLGDYSGVEIDCYSKGFNQKVQLLIHLKNDCMNRAGRLEAMLAHTFKYRSSQLFEFMASFTRPVTERLNRAAAETGAARDLVDFVRIHIQKVERLLEENGDRVPPLMIKNKLLRNFMDGLIPVYGTTFVARAQVFLKAVKQLVKRDFSLDYFYRTSEVIEEARSIGAGIVIPHPEQFWPILLREYDVDGCEVWNPQSQKYTEFLISILNRNNKRLNGSGRPLLIFMGDDTHMAEKIRDPKTRDPEKAGREIGVQPAWEDFNIKKTLIKADTDKSRVIQEYRQRLDG